MEKKLEYSCDKCGDKYGKECNEKYIPYNHVCACGIHLCIKCAKICEKCGAIKSCDKWAKICDNCGISLCAWHYWDFACGKSYCSGCLDAMPYTTFNVIKSWHNTINIIRHNTSEEYMHDYPDNPCEECHKIYDEYIQCSHCPEGLLINSSDVEINCDCGKKYCYACVQHNSQGGWCNICECGQH